MDNDKIYGGASLGEVKGGTLDIYGIKIADFTSNIATVSGGTLTMKNATSTGCANGVILNSGTFNLSDSSITASGNAVAVNGGTFNVSGNSEINGTIQLAEGQKINLSSGAKLTGSIKVKLTGSTKPTAGNPVVITSGGASANIPVDVLTSADSGYYIDQNSSNEWILTTTPPSKFTVTWQNADGTTLETDQNVLAGTTPEYNGATPTKADDEKYSYTFKGWDKEISEVTGDVTYTAQFTKTPNSTHFSRNENTYTIHDSTGWEIFAELIADGTTFSGKTILLDDDISTTKMAATSDSRRFSGIFDG